MLFALSKNTSDEVQVLKVGTFNHAIYGKFSIALSSLKQMKSNFDSNVRRQELDDVPVVPLDYKHDDENIAAGWIKNLSIKKDKKGVDSLFAKVEWTPRGAQKIEDREFAFISADYDGIYKDSETGKTFRNVLKGAALTNIPFLRDMNAVNLLSESRRAAFESLKLSGDSPDDKLKTGSNMDWKEILAGLESVSPEDKVKLAEAIEEDGKKLSEKAKDDANELKKAQDGLKLSEKTAADLKEKVADSKKGGDEQLTLALSEAKEAKEQVDSLKKTLVEAAKTKDFDLMLSEGKACEAQREPYMKGDMTEYAKKFEPVKLDESGANAKGDESGDSADKLEKLVQAKMKDDKELSYGKACSMTLSENPKLRTELDYN